MGKKEKKDLSDIAYREVIDAQYKKWEATLMPTTYEQKMAERVEKTRALVKAFNKRYAGGTVYLALNNEKNDPCYATFGIRFRFDDPFVDQEAYRSGSAYMYPSDALYLVLDVLAGDDKIEWNNTRSTGWLSHPVAEEKK